MIIIIFYSLGVDVRTPDAMQDHWYKMKSAAIKHLGQLKETGNRQMTTPTYYKLIWKNFADRESYIVDGIPFGMDSGDVDLSELPEMEPDQNAAPEKDQDDESTTTEHSGPLFKEDGIDQPSPTSTVLYDQDGSSVSSSLTSVTSGSTPVVEVERMPAFSTPSSSGLSGPSTSRRLLDKAGAITPSSILSKVTGVDAKVNLTTNLSRKRQFSEISGQSATSSGRFGYKNK
jgi:hypothetical protein